MSLWKPIMVNVTPLGSGIKIEIIDHFVKDEEDGLHNQKDLQPSSKEKEG